MLLPQDDRIIVLFVMGVVDERDFPRPNEFADALKLGTVLPKLCPAGTPPSALDHGRTIPAIRSSV